MRAETRQRRWSERWYSVVLSLALGLMLVPAFVGIPSGEGEHGRIWLRQPLRAPSGTAPSSTDPSKPILRRPHSGKHLQSRIVLVPSRARPSAARPSDDRLSAEEGDGALFQPIADRLPIKRAPPGGSEPSLPIVCA
jgi:hypothetical protein